MSLSAAHHYDCYDWTHTSVTMTAMTGMALKNSASSGLSPDLDKFLDESTAAYRQQLLTVLRKTTAVADLPSPEHVAELGTQVIAVTPSKLAASVGPVYTTTGVMKLLNVKRQQVDDRRRRGTILALRTADHQWVYPVFQFGAGTIRPAVRSLLDVFRVVNPDWWTVAAWMRHSRPEWDGKSAADLLMSDPEGLSRVLPLAHAAAARWAA